MDGVLINTEPLHYQCWVEIFKERYGIDLDYEVYKPCIGSTRLHFMNLIKENYGITFESLAVMNQIMKEKKDEIIARDGFPEMPGVGQMLCCLKDAGYRLAVASSSPKPVITETLETLDLMKYFDVVTSGDEVKNPKPAPDTFLFAAKQLGVPVDECIVIEDSTNGGKAAKAAKIPCIWMHNPDSGARLQTGRMRAALLQARKRTRQDGGPFLGWKRPSGYWSCKIVKPATQKLMKNGCFSAQDSH